jgi:hypothetical protein
VVRTSEVFPAPQDGQAEIEAPEAKIRGPDRGACQEAEVLERYETGQDDRLRDAERELHVLGEPAPQRPAGGQPGQRRPG